MGRLDVPAESDYPVQATYLRELFERLEIGVLIADDNAFYVDANRRACALYGRQKSDIIGHHLSEFIDGGRVAVVDVQWKAFLRDGTQSGMFEIQLPDRSRRMLQFNAEANFVPHLHCSFVSAVPDAPSTADEQALITICAWTHRVRIRDEWLSIEQYLRRIHSLGVTHGICPEALSRFIRDISLLE